MKAVIFFGFVILGLACLSGGDAHPPTPHPYIGRENVEKSKIGGFMPGKSERFISFPAFIQAILDRYFAKQSETPDESNDINNGDFSGDDTNGTNDENVKDENNADDNIPGENIIGENDIVENVADKNDTDESQVEGNEGIVKEKGVKKIVEVIKGVEKAKGVVKNEAKKRSKDLKGIGKEHKKIDKKSKKTGKEHKKTDKGPVKLTKFY